MNNICLIPARSGSKRIPNKNFKLFFGKPIIEYPIEIALKCGFDKIILSTDDNYIGNALSYKFGIDFLKRSKLRSSDDSNLIDAVKEVLEICLIDSGKICILYPTAVMVEESHILKANEMLNQFDTVFPIIQTGFHEEKLLTTFGDGVSYKYPQFNKTPSQICSKVFCHSGLFFYCNIETLLKDNNIIGNNCGAIKLKPWEAVEIDTKDDWKMLEIFYDYKIRNEK